MAVLFDCGRMVQVAFVKSDEQNECNSSCGMHEWITMLRHFTHQSPSWPLGTIKLLCRNL